MYEIQGDLSEIVVSCRVLEGVVSDCGDCACVRFPFSLSFPGRLMLERMMCRNGFRFRDAWREVLR